jgi:hypothetical protein
MRIEPHRHHEQLDITAYGLEQSQAIGGADYRRCYIKPCVVNFMPILPGGQAKATLKPRCSYGPHRKSRVTPA